MYILKTHCMLPVHVMTISHSLYIPIHHLILILTLQETINQSAGEKLIVVTPVIH